MTVWNLFLITEPNTTVAIFDYTKGDYVWYGAISDIPFRYMDFTILSVTVNIFSELVISI